MDGDGAAGESMTAVTSGDFVAEAGAQRTLNIGDRQIDVYRLSPFKSRHGLSDQVVVRRVVRFVDQPFGNAQLLDVVRRHGPLQDGVQVQAAGFPMVQGGLDLQAIHPTGHLAKRAKAQPGHNGAKVFGNEAHQPDEVRGPAGELFSEQRVLGGDTHRAGVQVAYPHHDAAQGD